MTKGSKKGAPLNQDVREVSAGVENTSIDRHVASLRGAEAVKIGERSLRVAGTVLVVLCAAVLVAGVVSASSSNARISRMKSRGIPVVVRVTGCFGNIGGSGSNGAGFTCHGSYSVDGVTYREVIGSMGTFVSSGTSVHCFADPSHHNSIELADAVKTSRTSLTAYFVLGALAVVLLAVALALRRVARKNPLR